jgi:hypothetical protein
VRVAQRRMMKVTRKRVVLVVKVKEEEGKVVLVVVKAKEEEEEEEELFPPVIVIPVFNSTKIIAVSRRKVEGKVGKVRRTLDRRRQEESSVSILEEG